MKTLILSLALCLAAGAQTEVRRAIALPSYKDLKYPPLPPLKVPDPTEITLSNGMKVLLLEDHELPLISGAALIHTGNLFDPPNKKGLAGITGEVLRSGGTKARTGDQLDQDLENVAASIESQIGETNGTLSFSCLKENTDQVLAIFRDLLSSPEFRQDKVDLAKTQSRSEISRRNDDPDGIAQREFSDIVYGRNTPYGWMIEYADIDNIQRQDLIDFYHRYYFPANITMEVIGDFSISDMKAKIEQLFGAWNYTQPAVPAFPKVEEKPAPGMYLASKEDTTQTFFHVGELGGELREKDYPALEVAAEILGGGFSSRLFQNVRTKHGWAYNISANWAANYDHPGTFDISGSTQSAHTVDTLKAIDEELEKIRTTEVADEELQTAKDTVLNGFVFNFDRPSKTINRLMIYQYYGYPKDFIFQYQKAIAAVTKADVLRVAQQHFQPKNLSYVAVGNPKDFGTPLTSLGMKVEPIDLTIPEPKQQAAQADPASQAKGKAALERVQQALGGADKLAATGTGFAVSFGGHILTNAHVVSTCGTVTARIGGVELPTQVVSLDAQNDLALLKVQSTFGTVLSLRDGARVQLGEAVAVFGYPLQGVISTSLNMTTGNISALAGLGDDARSLQFTAPVQPGSSGGPLVDVSGNVVGIVTSKLSALWAAKNIGDVPENVNFALKTSVIRDFLESRGVNYQTKGLGEAIPTTALPNIVSGAVFPLQCIGPTDTESQAAQADPASLTKGKTALERVQQALGGADKLAAVKDLQFHADLEVFTPGASMKVKQTNSFIAPSTVRQDNELPFLKQSVYSDGTSGWIASMQGFGPAPAPVMKQIRGEAFRWIVTLALSDRDADRTENQGADGVLEISSKDGDSVRITVDEKTGLPAKLAYQQSPAEGGAAVEEIYSDWRDVDGLHLPFQWSVMQGGKKFAGVAVQDYKINSGLTAETLGQRPAITPPMVAKPAAPNPSATHPPAPPQ